MTPLDKFLEEIREKQAETDFGELEDADGYVTKLVKMVDVAKGALETYNTTRDVRYVDPKDERAAERGVRRKLRNALAKLNDIAEEK